jgi:hypothetical protein
VQPVFASFARVTGGQNPARSPGKYPHSSPNPHGLVAVQHRRKKTASPVVHLNLGFLHARNQRAMAENGMSAPQIKIQ